MPPILEINKEFWLVGKPLAKFPKHALPATGEVIRRFLYFRVKDGKSVQESARATANEVLEIWNDATIPCKEQHNIIKDIKKIHVEWYNLRKSKSRATKIDKEKREKFLKKSTELFDVACSNALETMESEEDKAFYQTQKDGTRRRMSKRRLAEDTEKRSLSKVQKEPTGSDKNMNRKGKCMPQQQDTNDYSEDNTELSDCSDTSYVPPIKMRRKMLAKKILTEEICTSLDRTQISDRNAMYVLSAASQFLGQNGNDVILSRQTIRRERMRTREKVADEIQQSFNPSVPLTIHWDGKLLPDANSNSKKRVDRLAILVSGEEIEKLLGVPGIPSGTGEAQANGVHELLQKWNLLDHISSMCYDTTASNTGKFRGACTLLEKKLGRDLLGLACRHHIHELVVGAAFDFLFGPSTGPIIKLFQRFRDAWDSIDQNIRQTAMEDKRISSLLTPIREELIVFLRQQLLVFQPRDDYKELLQLTLVFLGADTEVNIRIRASGAYHRARWMAKLVYCLRIYIFSNQNDKLQLNSFELSSLRQFNVFVVTVYLKKWYTCQCPTLAPQNDLQMLKDLVQYDEINPDVAEVTYKTFSRHLWYLSEKLCGLGLFDSRVSIHEKKSMVMALDRIGSERPSKRITIDKESVFQKQLSDFVTEKSKELFVTYNVSLDFTQKDPSLWEQDVRYVEARKKLNKLKVVNDLAERGVSLIQIFNSVCTKNEAQRQNLLQVVENHRKQLPSCTKSMLVKRLDQPK